MSAQLTTIRHFDEKCPTALNVIGTIEKVIGLCPMVDGKVNHWSFVLVLIYAFYSLSNKWHAQMITLSWQPLFVGKTKTHVMTSCILTRMRSCLGHYSLRGRMMLLSHWLGYFSKPLDSLLAFWSSYQSVIWYEYVKLLFDKMSIMRHGETEVRLLWLKQNHMNQPLL